MTSRADTPEEIARILKLKQDLHLEGGMVIANPVPEKDELPKDYIDAIIDDAVKEAKVQGIHGKILHHSYSKQLLKNCRKKVYKQILN